MAIKVSRTADVKTLIDALGSSDEVSREAAIARLAVIGGRAVDRLVAAYASATRETRISILRALEGSVDPRAVPVARRALREGGEVAVAAAATLRPLLQTSDSRTATETLDALVEAALEPSAERRVRLAAFEALGDMPERVRAPIAAALHKDTGIDTFNGRSSLLAATWEDAIDGRLPDDAAALREAVNAHGESAPLGELQKLIEAVRAREIAVSASAKRDGWRQVRGAIHQVLALRGSRVAIYDLRETLASGREPLPATFVSALNAIGDDSCLEPIAAAWTAASEESAGAAWRQQLASAFEAIVKREKISRRSAVLKRVTTRWPGIRGARTSKFELQ